MDINAIVTMVTEFFTSIPWENVISGFTGSIAGIDWDSLGKLFEGFDLSSGPLQAAIDGFVKLFQTILGA